MVITNESARLERLVRDLLDLARLDAREFSLHHRPCDVGRVVATAVAGFEPSAEQLGITLEYTATQSLIEGDLDGDRLGQIVANLVENALRYARSTVSVALSLEGERVAVTVADNGPGIPAEARAHVFERLYTGRPEAGRSFGTGLGLSIVSELARIMGGDARVLTSDSNGTAFAVTVNRG